MVEIPSPTPGEPQSIFPDGRGCLFSIVPDIFSMVGQRRQQIISEQAAKAKFEELYEGLAYREFTRDQLPAMINQVAEQDPYQAMLISWFFAFPPG